MAIITELHYTLLTNSLASENVARLLLLALRRFGDERAAANLIFTFAGEILALHYTLLTDSLASLSMPIDNAKLTPKTIEDVEEPTRRFKEAIVKLHYTLLTNSLAS